MGFGTIVIAIIIGICVGLDLIKKTKKVSKRDADLSNGSSKQYNMQFEYRTISAKRCREVNSMHIRDLSAPDYDTVFLANGKKFVTNHDESILFYRLFLSKPTDNERKAVFVCIRDHQTRSITVELDEINGDSICEDEDLLKVWVYLLSSTTIIQSYIDTGL